MFRDANKYDHRTTTLPGGRHGESGSCSWPSVGTLPWQFLPPGFAPPGAGLAACERSAGHLRSPRVPPSSGSLTGASMDGYPVLMAEPSD
jgi:hypothetical protein